jgi:hypothetical protein
MKGLLAIEVSLISRLGSLIITQRILVQTRNFGRRLWLWGREFPSDRDGAMACRGRKVERNCPWRGVCVDMRRSGERVLGGEPYGGVGGVGVPEWGLD